MSIFRKSTRTGKKYDVYYNGKWIPFGDATMEQYKDSTGLGLYSHLNHNDLNRRKAYLARAKGIKNKKGELTWKDPNSSNYWAVRYLW